MKKNKPVIIQMIQFFILKRLHLFLLLFLLTPFVYSDISQHSFSFSSSGSDTSLYGVNLTAMKNLTLLNVTKSATSTATHCFVYNSSNTQITSGTFSGNTCVLSPSINMTANRTYYVMAHGNGASYTIHYTNGRVDQALYGDIFWSFRWNRNGGTLTPDFANGVINIQSVGYMNITTTPPTSPNETLTLKSNYSNNALTNYSARVVGSGYDQTFNDTAGTVTLNILQNDTRLFNITYTKVNWFNKTYYNVNVSTAHTGYIEQSYINFSLRQQVTNNSYTNYTIKLNGTAVCNTTTALCQIAYPDAGFYILNATPNNGVEFHALNTNITITALQNNTVYLYTHDHNVNIQARDSITNASILIYNVTSESYNRTDVRTTGTTNGNVSVDVIHDTYNFTVDAPGYALYNNVQNLTVIGEHNLTFYLQRTNGVAISIFNEANGSSLNGVDVTIYVYIDNSTLVYTNTTNTSTISYYNLTAGNYTFRFEATNYAVKEYYVNVGNRSFQYLNAYMLQTSSSTIFTFLDQTNGNVLEGVNVIVKKYINGSLVVVSSLTSDITGRVQLNYQANTPYYFTCTIADYNNKEFTLNPILFSTYTVKMTPTTSEVYEADYSGVTITHTPQRLNNGQNNQLFFTFGSPAGKFVLYGFNVTYNGTTNGTTGVNAYGDVLNTYIYISGARIGQTAQVQYFYITSDGVTNTYTFNMEIVGQTYNLNNTIQQNMNKTYGLGLFERIFIITIVLIIMAGAGALYGGALIGATMAIFILGIFSYLGFIPWFIGYPSMLFLFIYIVWGSSK